VDKHRLDHSLFFHFVFFSDIYLRQGRYISVVDLKSCLRILMSFSLDGMFNKGLDFVGDPDNDMDPGMFTRNFCRCGIEATARTLPMTPS